ncbi:MAG: UDP-N-acetylmuramoyl-tripeptide--D-alanyl-D-alanine ligase [Proteobacteria bacterium]|nr:UDP-N-acetylmuramoyl-tripeptide--D-alanyl-D-alanine ligase [Pseudomonadota bacterium]MBU1740182.1 UDP-N-acetylmuramoyl-tripeptide--D-alanyl-D-alanine ligase [Pseudomonadota bacterium]
MILAGLSIDRIAAAVGGRVVVPGRRLTFSGVSTDSRTVAPGELFVALVGPRFDGHDFIAPALTAGAAGAIVQAGRVTRGDWPALVCRIEVTDTLRALGELARRVRQDFTGPLAAVTGSNGKTTTKEMLAAILARRQQVLKTEGNLNNLIGLPLTLLRLAADHSAAVVEMGMDRPGEIARLTEIAAPTLGLVTNIGPAHLAGLGGVEAVAEAKGELFEGLSPIATALINADDPRVVAQARRCRSTKVTFGFAAHADVRAENPTSGPAGSRCRLVTEAGHQEIALPLIGGHNLMNALAAAAAALTLGRSLEDVAAALATFQPVAGRQSVRRLTRGVTLIDDTYNANPASMAAALRTLSEVRGDGRGLCALGDMLDLGDAALEAHRRVGRMIGALDLGPVFLLGGWAEEVAAGARESGLSRNGVNILADHDQLADRLKRELAPGDTVLVKGSRATAMDRVVAAIVGDD